MWRLLAVVKVGASLSISSQLWQQNRGELLNLLNHPLQVQLANGDLPYGSFVRLCHDRAAVLEGLEAAAGDYVPGISDERRENDGCTRAWKTAAEAEGRSIAAPPGVACYGCGGDHLNVDCPEERSVSGAASALAAVLRAPDATSRLAGAAAVCRGYGWACGAIVGAALGPSPYDPWLRRHGEVFSELGASADAALDAHCESEAVASRAYVAALSAAFNFFDSEASVAGLTASGASLEVARRRLDGLEPGFLTAQDRNADFVADLKAEVTGAAKERQASDADRKMSAAAAYLAAKKKAG